MATPAAPAVVSDDGSGNHGYALIAIGPQGRRSAASPAVKAAGRARLRWDSATGADAYVISATARRSPALSASKARRNTGTTRRGEPFLTMSCGNPGAQTSCASQIACQTCAQVVCRSHKLSATRTSRLPAAQNARTAAQVVGRAHRSPGRPHRLSGLSHSLTDERTSGRTAAQLAGTRPQVVCHAHSLPDTRTGRLTTRTSSRTRAQRACHAHGVQFPHAGVFFHPAGVIFRRTRVG
jgi:hypothetical protein